jgi:hypothetical protein
MHLPKAQRFRLLIAVALLSSVISSFSGLRQGPPEFAEIPQALAHQVELSAEVGGTLHIEPSDSPRAGEEVLAWFALTRKGGTPISLSECDCRVDIYQQPEQGDDRPILSPAPLAVQGDAAVGALAGIPGAKFTFPAVGSYSVVISGQPKADAASAETGEPERFAPFELAFDVTVAAGESVLPPGVAKRPAVPTSGQPWVAVGKAAWVGLAGLVGLLVGLGVLVGLGGWAIATLMRRRR